MWILSAKIIRNTLIIIITGTIFPITSLAYTIDGCIVTLEASDRTFDNTALIQGFLNNVAYTKIVIQAGTNDAPWLVCPLSFTHGNTEIHLNENAVLEAKPSGYPNISDCLLSAVSLDNIKVTGDSGSKIIMQKNEYADMPASEWRHALKFLSCSNVTVSGLTIAETGGDGIYLGDATGTGYCSNVTIYNVVIDSAARNALSVISVDGLTISGCTFKNTKPLGNAGAAGPWQGIDLEPNNSSERLTDITINDCIFQNNAQAGLALYSPQLNGSTSTINLTIKNSVMNGNTKNGIIVSCVPDSLSSNSNITFQNCTISDNKEAGIWVDSKSKDAGNLIFENCFLKNNCLAASNTAFLVNNYSIPNITGGNVQLKNLVIEQPTSRSVDYTLSLDGTYGGLENISGIIYPTSSTLFMKNATQIAMSPWLAKTRTAVASSTFDETYSPSEANDGIYSQMNSSNFWCCENNNDVNAWWSVDLGQLYELDKIKVQYRDISGNFHFVPLSVTVQKSNDGYNWTTVVSKSTNVPQEGTTYNENLYEYAIGGSGRYVRLLFEDGGSSFAGYKVVELVEVEVVPLVPVSTWELNETSGDVAADSNGNCNGTLINSPSWTTGRIGGGLTLNGTNQLITVADTSSLDIGTSDFSISLWLQRSDNATTNKRLIAKGASSDSDMGYAIVGSNTTLSFLLCNGITRLSTSCSIPSLEQWHHFVCTVDRTNDKARLYMNGSLQSELDISAYHGSDIDNNENLFIGAASNTGWLAWPGKIDKICIYKRVLTPGEISVFANSLSCHWRLDDNSGSTAIDCVGRCSGTLQNNPVWVTGKLGSALSLNGTNQLVVVSNNCSDTNIDTGDFSISLWFQRSDNTTINKRLIAKGASSDSDIGYAVVGSNTTLSFLLCNGITRLSTSCSIPSLDQWHHFVCTIDRINGKATLYMDGTYQTEMDISAYTGGNISNSGDLLIGAASNTGWLAWPGKVDDVRIYKRVLVDDEIMCSYLAVP